MASELGRSLRDGSNNDPNSAPEELLVFGYSCKLFRDNDKASYIENQKHLIPWMGDTRTGEKMMIDRYDVRGALYDLHEAEHVPETVELTEEEQAEEELCEQERYFALYHDEYQYQEYQEEQAKRLVAELGSDIYTYGQVGLNYEQQILAQPPPPPPPLPEEVNEVEFSEQQKVDINPVSHAVASDQEQQQYNNQGTEGYFPSADEDAFIPPKELNVPNGMTVPDTIKQNKIIIKTAKFIVAQGGQMEILIKTKQAGNPLFGFLSFDNNLNAYYKHMVAMMKNGRYRPTDEETSEKEVTKSDGQYLHPSLSGIKPDLTPGTPLTPHKPSADCAYSKLIHKIKEKQKNASEAASPRDSPIAWPATVASSTPNVPSSKPEDEKKAEYLDGTPIAKTVDSTPITPIFKIKGGLVDYPSFNATHDSHTEDSGSDSSKSQEPIRSRSKISRLETSPQESLNSVGDTSYNNIKWPPPDVQMVIDKMASYIIKNGPDFESMVRSRGDERFAFLNKKHKYFPYYRCKMRLYTEVYGDIFKDGGKDKSVSGNNDINSSKSTKKKKIPATISFSIKPREQDVKVDHRSTFPVESSTTDDEDMEEEERERRRIARDERRRKRKQKLLEERERREREEKEKKEKEIHLKDMSDGSEGSDDGEAYDIFKYALEMNDGDSSNILTERRRDHKKARKEKHHQKERGVGVNRDNKRQERRKKAAMFLSQLKKSGPGTDEEDSLIVPIGPQMPPEIAAQLLNSASQSPRSSDGGSLPSSSEHSRSPSPHDNVQNSFPSDLRSAPPLPISPQPPEDAPAPQPPPPAESPSHSSEDECTSPHRDAIIPQKTHRSGIGDTSIGSELSEQLKSLTSKDSSYMLGIVEDGSSLSSEICRSKARETESLHREKRSLKKRHRGRSSSRSPNRRKKRKRSRERSRRHKKGRSRSRSTEKSRRSHKKKHRKRHSSRHLEKERDSRRSKKSRRHRSVSSSSSSSESTERSQSASVSSSGSDDDVQIVESPQGPSKSSRASSVTKRESRSPSQSKKTSRGSKSPSQSKRSCRGSRSPSQSKRESRASSVISVDTSDISKLPRIPEENANESQSGGGQFPPLPLGPHNTSPSFPSQQPVQHEKPLVDISGDDSDKKEEKKPLFNPASSAAMAKIALGLRAKVHALLEKESKI